MSVSEAIKNSNLALLPRETSMQLSSGVCLGTGIRRNDTRDDDKPALEEAREFFVSVRFAASEMPSNDQA
jgi:hypothetical protein